MVAYDGLERKVPGKDEDMMALYDLLLSVLNRDAELYSQLEDAIVNEKDVLIRTSLDDLRGCNLSKETHLFKGRTFYDDRSYILKRIAQRPGLSEGNVNMEALSSFADDEHRKRLKDYEKLLGGLFVTIHELNNNNRHLLESSLNYVMNSMNFINNLIYPRSNSHGRSEGKPRTRKTTLPEAMTRGDHGVAQYGST
ncbi:MAG: flagellar protein FlgN [Smithellaceae bacterium]|nr:flagellar protein FlgN [Smithellaceae bacterium]